MRRDPEPGPVRRIVLAASVLLVLSALGILLSLWASPIMERRIRQGMESFRRECGARSGKVVIRRKTSFEDEYRCQHVEEGGRPIMIREFPSLSK